MRLAIISDTHFGDPNCGLVEKRGSGWELNSGRFDQLLKIIRPGAGEPADFLVLAGDAFDFSVASYKEAYEAGREFFRRAGELARDIIFLPGNHDYGVWQLVDNEISVLKPIQDRKSPRALMRTAPAVLDDRKEAAGRYASLSWPTTGVSYAEQRKRKDRVGIFLDHLCQPEPASKQKASAPKDQKPPCFWLAYPNLYLLTRGGKTMLLTHGHYFSHYWAMGAELAMGLAGSRLPVRENRRFGEYMGLADMVGANSPLSDFACSGIGQAEPLTPIAREIQYAMKDQAWGTIAPYVDRVPEALAKTFQMSCWEKALVKLAFPAAKCKLRRTVENYVDARDNQGFLWDPDTVGAVGRFLLATFREIDDLNDRDPRLAIRYPHRMIYGHTHERTPWDRGDWVRGQIDGIEIKAFNCGGWLKPEGVKPIKAEVFIYDSNPPPASASADGAAPPPPEVWDSKSIY